MDYREREDLKRFVSLSKKRNALTYNRAVVEQAYAEWAMRGIERHGARFSAWSLEYYEALWCMMSLIQAGCEIVS